jgi:hypothetical protein
MSIFFGIVFMVVGLALAVMLGIVLYRDPKNNSQTVPISAELGKNPETA